MEKMIQTTKFLDTYKKAIYKYTRNSNAKIHNWEYMLSENPDGEKKINNIETLIDKLEGEVMSAPAPTNPEQADNYTARQFQVRKIQKNMK